MRKTDRCGKKPVKEIRFSSEDFKKIKEAADRIAVKNGYMTGKRAFRNFRVMPKNT